MIVKLNLKSGFKTVEEGVRTLQITGAQVTPSGKPEKISLNMKDVEDGATLINSYNINNSTSMWAFGILLNTALGLNDGDDFDTKDIDKLVGICVKCEIAHSEYNGKTYANVKKVLEKVDRDAELTELAENIADTLYSRSDLETEDDLD